jgi:hypothetical protein
MIKRVFSGYKLVTDRKHQCGGGEGPMNFAGKGPHFPPLNFLILAYL